MISAAVKGIARLTYEFTDLISKAFNVLPSAFLLLQRKNREINKVSRVDCKNILVMRMYIMIERSTLPELVNLSYNNMSNKGVVAFTNMYYVQESNFRMMLLVAGQFRFA